MQTVPFVSACLGGEGGENVNFWWRIFWTFGILYEFVWPNRMHSDYYHYGCYSRWWMLLGYCYWTGDSCQRYLLHCWYSSVMLMWMQKQNGWSFDVIHFDGPKMTSCLPWRCRQHFHCQSHRMTALADDRHWQLTQEAAAAAAVEHRRWPMLLIDYCSMSY